MNKFALILAILIGWATNATAQVVVGPSSGRASDAIYGGAWDGSTLAPSQNAVYDKIEALIISGGGLATSDLDNSAKLATILSDENGTGKVIFAQGTLAITSGKTATFSNTLTFAGTDSSTLNIGTGGTLGTAAYTASSVYQVAAPISITTSTGLTTAVGVGFSSPANLGSSFTTAVTAASAGDLIELSPVDLDTATTAVAIKDNQVFDFKGAAFIHTGGSAVKMFLASGTGGWTLRGPVTLTGVGSGTEYGVHMTGTAQDVTIQGLTIVGFGAATTVGTGAAIGIENNSASSPRRGGLITGNTLTTSSNGVYLGDNGTTIHAEYWKVIGNAITGCGNGVFSIAGNTVVADNTINDNVGIGVVKYLGSNNSHGSITGNTINHNGGGGIQIVTSTNGEQIVGNNIYADAQFAIELDACRSVNITGNSISGYIKLTNTQTGISTLTNNSFKAASTAGVDASSQTEFLTLQITGNTIAEAGLSGGAPFWLNRIQENDPLTETTNLAALWMSNHGAVFRGAGGGSGTLGAGVAVVDGIAACCWKDRAYRNRTNWLINATTNPDYELTDLNGVPSVKFTRANSDTLESATLASSAQSGTIVIVVQPTADTGTENHTYFYQGSATGSGSFFGVYRENEFDKLYVQFSASRNFSCDTSLLTEDLPHVIVISSNGSTHAVTIDGIPQSLTYSSGTNDGTWLGDMTTDDVTVVGGYRFNSAPATDFPDALIGLIGVYDTISLTDNAQQVQAIARRAAEEFKVTNYTMPVDTGAYATNWNGSDLPVSRDAAYDKIETMGGGGATTLDGLTDVVITTSAANDILLYDGAQWENTAGVALADPAADRLLFWDDSATSVAYMDFGSGISAIGTTLTLDADLVIYAGITPSANVQSFLTSADYAAMRTQLELQPLDADLTAISALATTSFGRGVLDDADAAALQTTAGVVIGTNVQAYDPDLTTYAGITPSANVQSFLTSADYAAMMTQLAAQASDADLNDLADGSLTGSKVQAATTTNVGVAEAAIASEVTTGTDAARYVSPDALAGSDFGKVKIPVSLHTDGSDLTTGDGKAVIIIPPEMDGYKLVAIRGGVGTVSSSGTPTFQVRRVRDIDGTPATQDMLTTLLTVDPSEHLVSTATAYVIDTASSHDIVNTNDFVYIDCDVAGTGTKNGQFWFIFQLP